MRIIKFLAKYAFLIISIIIHVLFFVIYQYSNEINNLNVVPGRSIINSHQINFDLHKTELSKVPIKKNMVKQIDQAFVSNSSNTKKDLSTHLNVESHEISSNTNSTGIGNTIHIIEPEYPKMARLKNQEGSVYIRVEFDEQGLATSIKILESSQNALLDEAAIKAARQWKVSPHSIHELDKKIVFKLQ